MVEFFGDYWHAHPEKYNCDDIVHHDKTAYEIWAHDEKRIDTLTSNGYDVYIVWEKDYKNDELQTLSRLVEEIKSM